MLAGDAAIVSRRRGGRQRRPPHRWRRITTAPPGRRRSMAAVRPPMAQESCAASDRVARRAGRWRWIITRRPEDDAAWAAVRAARAQRRNRAPRRTAPPRRAGRWRERRASAVAGPPLAPLRLQETRDAPCSVGQKLHPHGRRRLRGGRQAGRRERRGAVRMTFAATPGGVAQALPACWPSARLSRSAACVAEKVAASRKLGSMALRLRSLPEG